MGFSAKSAFSRSGRGFIVFMALAAIAVLIVIVTNKNQSAEQTGNNNANNSNTAATAPQNSVSDEGASNAAVGGTEAEEQAITTAVIEAAIKEKGFWMPSLSSTTTTPATLSGGTDSNNSVTYNLGAQNAISVVPTETVDIIRASIGNPQENEITIDGLRAVELTGVSQKDGSTTHYIIIYKGEKVYLARGDEEFLTNVKTQMQL